MSEASQTMNNASKMFEGRCCRMRRLRSFDIFLVKATVAMVKTAVKKGSTVIGSEPFQLVLTCSQEDPMPLDLLRELVLR